MDIRNKRTGEKFQIRIPGRLPEFKDTATMKWGTIPVNLDGRPTDIRTTDRRFFIMVDRWMCGQYDAPAFVVPGDDLYLVKYGKTILDAPMAPQDASDAPTPEHTAEDVEADAKAATDAAVANGTVIRVSSVEDAAAAVTAAIMGAVPAPAPADDVPIPSASEAGNMCDGCNGLSMSCVHGGACDGDSEPDDDEPAPVPDPEPVTAPATSWETFKIVLDAYLANITTKLPTQDITRRIQKLFPADIRDVNDVGFGIFTTVDGVRFKLARGGGRWIIKEV